jgi:hypothetical protein
VIWAFTELFPGIVSERKKPKKTTAEVPNDWMAM